jgi:hypothetical protein
MPRVERIADFLLFLIEILTIKGVGKVVLGNIPDTDAARELVAAVTRRADDAGLAEMVTRQWQQTTGTTTLTEAGWLVTSHTETLPRASTDAQSELLELIEVDNCDGIFTRTTSDQLLNDTEQLAAALAWQPAVAEDGMETLADAIGEQCFGRAAQSFCDASLALNQALAEMPAGLIANGRQCWHAAYPALAMKVLLDLGATEAKKALDTVAAAAATAETGFAAMVAECEAAESKPFDPAPVKTRLGEAIKLKALSQTLLAFLPAAKEIAAGKPPANLPAGIKNGLTEAIRLVQENKPRYVAACALQELSALLKLM